MSDLTDFMLARIDEDEEGAEAATTGSWYSCEGTRRGTYGVLVEDSLGDWLGNIARETTEDDAEHIARHDPTRVLAECEANRRIVERHAREGGVESWMDDDWISSMSERERTGYCGWCTYDDRTILYPCPDLRDLALPHADHPDYREEWKP